MWSRSRDSLENYQRLGLGPKRLSLGLFHVVGRDVLCGVQCRNCSPWPRPLREHSLTILSLHMDDPYTKSEVSRYFTGCKILKCVSWSWQGPFQEIFFIGRLGLATVNLQTKFEVSNYTHYEHMRSGAKCTNWGSLGHLGVTEGHRQCLHAI